MTRKLRNLPAINPAASYAEAIRRLEDWQAAEPASCNPAALMRWMVHGERQPHCIVLLHGLTATPIQFYPLGDAFFQRGYNVIIPRFPAHALQDLLTDAPAHLTAEQLVATLFRVLDIAHGLGENVSVVGLSMGAVVTSWAAQNCPDIDRAMIISPAFAVQAVPLRLTPLVVSTVLVLPNFFRWWDAVRKADPSPPYNNYPRLASRALAQTMRLGLLVRNEARHQPPAARQVIVVTNDNDPSVDNRAANGLVNSWLQSGANNVRTHTFEKQHQLPHDLVSIDTPQQRSEIVFPILLDLMTGT